jgi:ABC-2 type transport system ATP-binding protein
MEEIIEVKNVIKKFKDKTALNGLNFKVQKGEIFGFLGPSGAGKTTTIKLLTSQLLPSSGEAKTCISKSSFKQAKPFIFR